MNEMRKLMETIEEIDEMPGRTKGQWEKRDPSEVLQYFNNKRRGGQIKSQFRAFYDFDGEAREVTSISITQGEFGKEYHLSGPGPGGWRALTLDRIEVYKLEQVL